MIHKDKRKSVMKEKGYTVLEVLIGITILSIGVLGIAGLAGTAIKTSSYSQAMTQANNLAQQRIERLRSIDFNNIESSDSTTALTDLRRTCTQTTVSASRPVYTCTPVDPTIALGGKDYTWVYTVTRIDLDGNNVANPNVDGVKRIDVTLSWTDQLWHATKSATFTTLRVW